MQEFGFIPEINFNPDEFWKESNKLAKENAIVDSETVNEYINEADIKKINLF